MKKNRIIISIKEPCHENWDNMQVNEQGKYCASCEKTVIDFTQKTNAQLLDFYSKNEGNICGRFKKTQLDRPISEKSETRFPLPLAAAASILMTFVNPQNTHAQDVRANTTPLNIPVINPGEHQKDKQSGTVENLKEQDSNILIKGKVMDAETRELIIGTNIICKTFKTGTATDFDGEFALFLRKKRPKKFVDSVNLVVSYSGYFTKKIKCAFQNQEMLEIYLESTQPSDEVVIKGGTFGRKPRPIRDFFRKIFRRNRN